MMEPFVRRFIRASVVWLVVGVVIGVAMTWLPGHVVVYRTAHAHANLLGFVSMMIFGVAYHVLPRFAGRPLHARRLAIAHFWIANVGLAALVAGFLLRIGWPDAHWLLRGGGLLSALGALAFAYNVWRTIGDGSPAPVTLGGPVARPGMAPLGR
jgi:cbb3-type cytochrome oxidase subunit 1